ncbi:hypothetical protein DAT35_13260 [Vitiosangium sp. GDMCC 1.1324]|nr:hypothetical protein DAT35_13260 [Vitiosangium sp. GDMCC 1.1324]
MSLDGIACNEAQTSYMLRTTLPAARRWLQVSQRMRAMLQRIHRARQRLYDALGCGMEEASVAPEARAGLHLHGLPTAGRCTASPGWESDAVRLGAGVGTVSGTVRRGI